MKKLLIVALILLLANPAFASTRQKNWITGETITANDLNSDWDNYYSEGVVSANIAANTITAADIAASAIGASEIDNTADFTMNSLDLTTSSAVDALDITQAYNSGGIDINKSGVGAGNALDINNAGTGYGALITQASTGIGLNVANTGTGYGLSCVQTGILSGTAALRVETAANQTDNTRGFVQFRSANTSSVQDCLEVANLGANVGISISATAATGKAHMYLAPVASVAGTTEGQIYADGDAGTEILYYRSGSAWAGCNPDNDFGEIMQIEGNKSNYEIGDVISIGTQKIKKLEYESGLKDKKGKKVKKINDSKFSDNSTCVTKSKGAYDTSVVGVYSDRTGFILDDQMAVNDNRITVGLIGLVRCKVNNEGGQIKTGDLLTSSSTRGVAMKATIDSFDKIGSVIGKAREDFNGTSGMIEIAVGVK